MAKARKKQADRTSVWVSKATLQALHKVGGNDGDQQDTMDDVIQGLLKFLRVNDGTLPDGRAKVLSWRSYLAQPGPVAADWRQAVPKK